MCHPSSTQYTHAQLSGQILMFRIISCRFDLFLIPTRATNWKYVRFCRTIVSKGIFVSMDQMDKVDIAQKHSQQNKLNGGLTSFTGKCTLGLIRCCKFDPFFDSLMDSLFLFFLDLFWIILWNASLHSHLWQFHKMRRKVRITSFQLKIMFYFRGDVMFNRLLILIVDKTYL